MGKERTNNSPPSTVKFTRSGRKITSRFRRLSLNDDNCNNADCKSDLNGIHVDVELSKPDGKYVLNKLDCLFMINFNLSFYIF